MQRTFERDHGQLPVENLQFGQSLISQSFAASCPGRHPKIAAMRVVSAANVFEQAGAKLVFAKRQQWHEQFSRLVRIWVDGGYQGEKFHQWVI